MKHTFHKLINGDSRDMYLIKDESIHLVLTSPPYWNLKRYNENPAQLGHIHDYEVFLSELEKVWRHAFRVLVPGGRLVCIGVEIDPEYCRLAAQNLKTESADLFSNSELIFEKAAVQRMSMVKEKSTRYDVQPSKKRPGPKNAV